MDSQIDLVADMTPSRNDILRRAEALNPDVWVTPDAILDGVRNADTLFDRLRAELTTP